MSRARELAKMGGSTQVVSGVSSFVGVSTFASDVFMFEDLSVAGDLNVTGDLSYDETTATNSRITGVSTTKDLVVTQNADVAGIVSATTFEGTLATTNLSGTITNDQLAGSIANDKLSNSSVSYGGVSVSLGGSDATPAFDLQDATGLPISSGVSGLGANVATFLGTPSSSNLAAAVTDETGSGALVFGTAPTISNPVITGATIGADDVTVTGGLVVGAALTVTGNLQVDGTTTTINSTTVTIDDLNLTLANDAANPSAANGAGLTINGASATLTYAATGDKWVFNKDLDLDSNDLLGVGTVTAGNLDISGNVDVDGTLEADAITVNGSTLDSVIQGTTVTRATNANNVRTGATSDNEDFFLTFVAINNTEADDDNAVKTDASITYNPSTNNLTVGGAVTATSFSGSLPTTDLTGTISNAQLENSTISGTSLGSNLPTATFATSGTGLSGSATYNGTGTATFTVTSNATSANTASAIVARDGSGNFSAGTITATLTGNVTGNVSGSSGSCTGNSATATTATNLSGGSVAATTGTFSGNVDIGNATSDTLTVTARVDSDIVPSTNNARALGTSSLRWSNIYSNDLDLSNEGSVNDFDGTWGSYLIQEGEEDLFILNRRNGKKYKFVLQEV